MRWEEIQHWILDDRKAMNELIVRGIFDDKSKLDSLSFNFWQFCDSLISQKVNYWKIISNQYRSSYYARE